MLDNPIVQPAHVFADFRPRPVAPGNMPVTAARLLAGGSDGPVLRVAAGLAARGDPRGIGSAFPGVPGGELAAWISGRGCLCPARRWVRIEEHVQEGKRRGC